MTVPTLITERLTLRPPQLADFGRRAATVATNRSMWDEGEPVDLATHRPVRSLHEPFTCAQTLAFTVDTVVLKVSIGVLDGEMETA